MKSPRSVALALLLVAAVACSGAQPESFDPARRAALVAAAGCDLAADRTGSGVAVGDGLVVTVAHLVARAERLEVGIAGGAPVAAEVAAYDPARDLALLRVPGVDVPAVEMAAASARASGVIVGGAASGDLSFEVIRPVSLSIEEVLGTERHSRVGYEIDAVIRTGDSGAGAYDAAGRLVGIVFALTAEGGSSWLTAGSEVEQFLESPPSGAPPGCR